MLCNWAPPMLIVKGCVQDADFILHKMYHVPKLLCNISPKTGDFFKDFF